MSRPTRKTLTVGITALAGACLVAGTVGVLVAMSGTTPPNRQSGMSLHEVSGAKERSDSDTTTTPGKVASSASGVSTTTPSPQNVATPSGRSGSDATTSTTAQSAAPALQS